MGLTAAPGYDIMTKVVGFALGSHLPMVEGGRG